MKAFRMMSHVLVVAMILFVGDTMAKSVLDPLIKTLDNIFVAETRSIAIGALSMAGGLTLKEQLHKKNPVAIALVSGGLGASVGQCAEAGLAATTTSIIISGSEYMMPKKMREVVNDCVPPCLNSEDTKIVLQILLSTMAGYFFGKEAKKSS